MQVAVHALVDALHEPDVHVPEEGVAGVVGAGALDMSNADEAVKIADRTRVAADLVRRRRVGRPWLMEVDVRTANGLGTSTPPGIGRGATLSRLRSSRSSTDNLGLPVPWRGLRVRIGGAFRRGQREGRRPSQEWNDMDAFLLKKVCGRRKRVK